MPVYAICPSLKCKKILELPENVRGREVNCRYCGMHFRVPQIRRRPLHTYPQPVIRPEGPVTAQSR
jgi:DNA-directed RNA polymerase subunit RPC12/RpoP